MDTKQVFTASWLGRVNYDDAWHMQKRIASANDGHRLLLLEHPPVYTFGRLAKTKHLLFNEAELQREGITIHHSDRGGDITYHGPGQLVGYLIFNLRRLYGTPTPDLHHYLRTLEQAIIDTLATFGIQADRFPGYTGVWVEMGTTRRKIAAIGIKVNAKGVASHGFALNINPNMAHFQGIVPCGIRDYEATSMAELINTTDSAEQLCQPIIHAIEQNFNLLHARSQPLTSQINEASYVHH